MTSINDMIDFVEQLLKREIHFLTSDEAHLSDVLRAFRMAKKDGKIERKTIQDLIQHYRVAGEAFMEELRIKVQPADTRSIDQRLHAIIEQGQKIAPVEYYNSVRSAMQYVELIYGI